MIRSLILTLLLASTTFAANELTALVPSSSSGVYAVIRNPADNGQGYDVTTDDGTTYLTYDRTDADQQIALGSAIAVGVGDERQFATLPSGLSTSAEYVYDVYDSADELIGTFRYLPGYSAQSNPDVNVASVDADAITASAIATDAVTEITTGVFSTNVSAFTTNSTLGAIVNDLENAGRLDNLLDTIESTVSSNSTNAVATLANSVAILADTAEIGVAGAGLTEAGGTGDHLTAIDISGALATYDAPTRTEATADKDEVIAKLLAYVQLLARKDAAITTDNATELAEINADGGSGAGSYAATTDSQEAIRDRGDAAWVTGSASVNQPTALDRPEQLLKIGGRRDGVIRSPDIVTIAPGETKVFGFHFPWGTRPRPADAVAPTGLTGELSASLVGDNGLAPEWVSVEVVATDSATDGTTDYAIVEVTDRDGNVLQLVAEIRVKALHP